jgi:hypothetical protein
MIVALVGVARGEAALVGVACTEGSGVEPNPLVNGRGVTAGVAKEEGVLVGVRSRRI